MRESTARAIRRFPQMQGRETATALAQIYGEQQQRKLNPERWDPLQDHGAGFLVRPGRSGHGKLL
jgi:hypothetical protein